MKKLELVQWKSRKQTTVNTKKQGSDVGGRVDKIIHTEQKKFIRTKMTRKKMIVLGEWLYIPTQYVDN